MPAARTTSKARRTNLRVPASSFVGRREELLAIVDAFEVARLVTLVGPGGMGKTRLAIEHARARLDSLARRGRGGVWIVELAEARSAEDAMAEVARVLEVPLAGRASERERSEEIARAIARLGPVLVVLDDLERIAAPAAPLLAHWLSLAPSARFLVTSRIALGLPEERTLTVGSLGPGDARALFLDRAAQVRTTATSESEPGLVERIVDAIDRMPLAIELAASRTRVLSTKELSARLDRPLALLSGGVVRERHASVRGAVLDSLALLDPHARRAFALLASVDDGFALDTAEAVLSPLCTGDVSPLETLEALVRTSLVRVEAGPAPTRYALFATIREVAEGSFDEEPLRHEACIAHAEHHLRLVRAARAGGVAEEARIARDLEHFLRARATAISLGRAHDAVELTLAVEPVLARRGLSSQRASLVDEALTSIAPSDDTRALRAQLHLARGLARRELGEADGAAADFEAALALTDPTSDPGLHATALLRVGGIADLRGDTAAARERFARALSLLARTPSGALRDTREAEALLRLGHAQRREGALDEAHATFSRAVAAHRSLGLDEGLAASLYELGVVEMFREHVEAAFAAFDEGLIVARRGGVRIMEGGCLTARGCLLQDLGRWNEALAHHAEAASIFRDHASRYREASALYYLATTYLERGDAAEALALITQARERLEGVGAPRYDALVSGGAALACAALGRHDAALDELARAAIALAKVPNEPSLSAALAIHRETVAHRRGESLSSDALSGARARAARSPSDDTRFALRELERAMGLASVEAHDALCVWGAGEAFLAPGGSKITLPPRSPMRRILDHLTTRREAAPGEPVTMEAIVAAGWPDERMSTDAGLNRAYVAVATLRKRGLRDAIVSGGGGYAISRGVVVRRMA